MTVFGKYIWDIIYAVMPDNDFTGIQSVCTAAILKISCIKSGPGALSRACVFGLKDIYLN